MTRQRLLRSTFLACILLLVFVESSEAEQQNITIDDAYPGGDPGITLIYLPVSGWVEGSVCVSCDAHPDPSQTVDGTWHDASSNLVDNFQRSIEFNFTGSAVYAYFILANNFTSFSPLTYLTISMDGEDAGTFVHNPSPDPTYEYNVLVYSSTELENVPHSLNISSTGFSPTVMLFDYFDYTVDTVFAVTSDGSTSSSTSTLTSSATSISNMNASAGPSATDKSMGTFTQIPQSRALVDGLIAAIIASVLIILFLLLLLFKQRRGLFLFNLSRHFRRGGPRTHYTTRTTGIDPLTLCIVAPATTDLPVTAEHSTIAPVEKGRQIQSSELQQRLEMLRTDIPQADGPSNLGLCQPGDSTSTTRATIRTPESALRSHVLNEVPDPRITKQIAALRDQIRHWEEQLTIGGQ